jgi:hypothetical protein
MTISLDSSTSNPVGTENGLITRNIPSGTQDVSGSEVIADQGNPNDLIENSSNYAPSFILPEGIELSGSMEFGISQYNTNSALAYNISIIGYEY